MPMPMVSVDDAPMRTQATPVADADANIRATTPMGLGLMPEASTFTTATTATAATTTTADADDESRRALFSDLYRKSEARVALLFTDDGSYNHDAIHAILHSSSSSSSRRSPKRQLNGNSSGGGSSHPLLPPPTTDHAEFNEPPRKKAKRAIDEDDYDDDDDDEEEDAASNGGGGGAGAPPQQLLSPSKTGSSPVHSVGSPDKNGTSSKPSIPLDASFSSTALSRTQSQSQLNPSSHPQSQSQAQSQSQPQPSSSSSSLLPPKQGTPEKSSEDVRKALEDARHATEEAARRSFFTVFHTLENDRMAMLEQQQLEESEKQIQAEMEKHGSQASHGAAGGSGGGGSGPGQGTLSSANLGASSLTLKHLLARIDMKRDQVKATDAELRSLINEVRKNRSKWASEENVGQEELYEALEKVLSELKAHTEYSTPFLQRVNKREAPDYHLYVKQPMDLGTMTKKLKGLQYKSKNEFVLDLNLVWDNCLKYNRDASHPLRRMANNMRKEAEKLIPLIPDVTIRSRAEVEAEERRKQNGGDDGGDDDSDDEPIMSSRGRKTGTKGVGNKSRGGAASSSTTIGGDRSTTTAAVDLLKEGTPSVDQKPVLQLNGLLSKGSGREGSELGDTMSNGFSTPLGASGGLGAGSLTPSGLNHGDAMDIDGVSAHSGGVGGGSGGMAALNRALNDAAEQAHEDDLDKMWKQVTKKDRAIIAKQRFELFRGNKLNVDAPALLRSKEGMQWYLKGVKQAEALGIMGPASRQHDEYGSGHGSGSGGGVDTSSKAAADTTLVADMETKVEKVVPDYYEPESIVPDIPLRMQWVEDDEGQVVNQNEEFLRLLPEGYFVSPASKLTKRMEANMRQIQETRKVCSKIAVVKQMQIQTQIYQNQFQRYDPEPFHEADIEPHYVSGDGPFMAAETSRAALQRTVGKIFFHAGFEELQPSAMDAMTDIAADYFTKLCRTFNVYNEAEKKEATGAYLERGARFQPRYTPEEVVLHTLYENGHDIDSLELYAREEVERLGTKLGGIHERMKAHLGDLLRPALQDGGTDAFQDGSDQFVGGDFADELGEDFFGFKAMGLDRELGLDILSVPLHLLQSRVRNQHAVDAPTGVSNAVLFADLEPLDPITTTSIVDEIGLIKNFFLAKLHANNDQPLVEDEDLPVKQRRPRPRLGATGKIVSPQKRPPKEQIAMAKRKKREMAAAAAAAAAANGNGTAANEKGTPKKSKPATNTTTTTVVPVPTLHYPGHMANGTGDDHLGSQGSPGDDKDDGGGGMMSPESLER